MFRSTNRLLLIGCFLASYGWPGVAVSAEAGAEEAQAVGQLYEQKCASCHGADGQGVAGVYETALAGTRSVEELAGLIERTMPEDDPDDCVGAEAAAMAQYIYDAFYSAEARQRLGLEAPLRLELMRLTVPQFRNSVADLLAHFTPGPAETRARLAAVESGRRPRGGGRRRQSEAVAKPLEAGIRGLYYGSEGMNKANQLALERVDGQIDFNFAATAPVEGVPAEQFAIVWEGALSVPETGDYQFRVATPNGARLYVNFDPAPGIGKLRDDSGTKGQTALIDAWVSSGSLREESARLFLLGGRKYPIRLEFFKYKEPTASIKLEWKPPHGIWAVLDGANLSTEEVSRTYVVETPFPPDDRSQGFEQGRSVSPQWQVAVTGAAVATADEVVKRLPVLVGPAPKVAADEAAQADEAGQTAAADPAIDAARRDELQQFIAEFARVAFRRPLSADEQTLLRERFFDDATDPELAVRRAAVWVLCSPEFLYPELAWDNPENTEQPPDPHAVAARLALSMWDSLPDAELMQAADAGELTRLEQVQTQSRRMLADPRAHHKLRGFYGHWLELEDRDLAKDQQLFPHFDEAVIADLRRSLEMFLDGVIWSESSDYRQLLTADYLWLSPRLRSLYQPAGESEHTGEAGPAEAGESKSSAEAFEKVVFAPHERSGVMTHPYLLSALAYHNNSSPIHRGVFLSRKIVGRTLNPPPVATAFENDQFDPDLTMREKVTQLTRHSNCMSCHAVINPLGFAMEHYDAVGRWRTEDNGKPLDTLSEYTRESGEAVQLANARQVAELALASPAAQRGFIAQLAQHWTKQFPAAYGPETIERLAAAFATEQFHVQNLLVRIATIDALRSEQASLALAASPTSAMGE
jgi:hypothetical protein